MFRTSCSSVTTQSIINSLGVHTTETRFVSAICVSTMVFLPIDLSIQVDSRFCEPVNTFYYLGKNLNV